MNNTTDTDPSVSPAGANPESGQPKKTQAWRKPKVWVPVLLALAVVGGIVLSLTQPWKLFIDQVVDEELPAASASVEAGAEESVEPASSQEAAPKSAPAASDPTTLASGDFISHEHTTTGSAKIVELEDGRRILRLEGLDTSNGPDLKVWLTDAPVIEGTDGWFVFDDGQYLDLGALKGNVGNQNYVIPADADISDLTSVTIWCDRFSVSFGAAELA